MAFVILLLFNKNNSNNFNNSNKKNLLNYCVECFNCRISIYRNRYNKPVRYRHHSHYTAGAIGVLRVACAKTVATSHVWLFKLKFKTIRTSASHISNTQQLHGTSSYHFGETRYRKFSSWQEGSVELGEPAQGHRIKGDSICM